MYIYIHFSRLTSIYPIYMHVEYTHIYDPVSEEKKQNKINYIVNFNLFFDNCIHI